MSVAVVAVKAVMDKYAALGFSPKPPIWADEAPVATGGGKLTPPYVIVKGAKDRPTDYLSGLDAIEAVRVELSVYAASKTAVAAIAAGIMRNGQSREARAGLDDARTMPLPAGYSLNKIERTDPGLVVQEKERGSNALPVFRADLCYLFELFVAGAANA